MHIQRPPGTVAGIALLLALLAAGCGQKEDTIAVVGDRTITSREFMDVVRGNEDNYPIEPDSARRVAFDDMLRRELMLVEALRRGMGDLPETQAHREAIENRVLVQELYVSEAPPDLPVSEAEIRTLFEWRDSTANILLMYTPTREAIDSAAGELERGGVFESVADRYNLPGTLPPGGQLGWRVSGDLVDPLDKELRTAPVGSVVGPLEAPTEGWFLIKVQDRKVNEQPPFEEQRLGLENMIRQRKQRELGTKFYTDLRDNYEIALAPGGAQDVFIYYNQRLRDAAEEVTSASPSEEQLQRVLATYRGADGTTQPYTFADARTDMEEPRSQRPDMTVVPAIERWVESQVVRRAALLEARSRALHQDPDIARKIDREVETFIVDGIFAEEVTQQVKLTEADLRAAYERRKDVLDAPFEQLPQNTLLGLQNDAAAFKSDEIFRSFTDFLKENIEPFEVHEDRLARIPWPIPEAPGK